MAKLGVGEILAVASVSAQFTSPMAQGHKYVFSCNVDCWVRVTATGGVAAAADNNHCYVKGQLLELEGLDASGTTNAFVHAIRQVSDGDASLLRIDP